MMKKIACLLGSPRSGGNSETIARKIIETAEAQGASASIFALCKMDFKGCCACLACKKGLDECAVQDDLTEALDAIREADILIIASPVYFGQLTGVMKMAVDRMYSFVDVGYLTGGNRTRLAKGKKCAFILTQGAPEDVFPHAYTDYADFFGPDWFGYEMHLIRGLGLNKPTDAGENADLMKQAEELGRKVMG
ncbi:MAG: flavodoxin family protein [Armatimonadia bacterium]